MSCGLRNSRRGFPCAQPAENNAHLIPITVLFLLSSTFPLLPAVDSPPGISRAASQSCSAKVAKLEEFAAKNDTGSRQTTRISQDEINSFLALDLSARYNPCLKSLMLTLQEGGLQGDAVIDFDRLGMSATRMLSRLVASMFSGMHKLSAQGKIIAEDGKANFQLETARFDSANLPNFLVEEIITAVGKKQKPPFDPIRPSQMPYRIRRVELHPGFIVIYQ